MKDTIDIMGMKINSCTEEELTRDIMDRIAAGRGGSLLTANLDILRIFSQDGEARKVYAQSDLCAADGMPLVWAAQIMGQPLPGRVAGSTLSEGLAAACAETGTSLFLLGGEPRSAEQAAEVLREKYPGLRVEGDSSLYFSRPPKDEEIDAARSAMAAAEPQLLLVGLGSPKQEFVIARLRQAFPGTFMVGVGGTFGFLSGRVARAPRILQQVGLEWMFRLAQQPKRLAARYLLQDLPFFASLITHSARNRRSH